MAGNIPAPDQRKQGEACGGGSHKNRGKALFRSTQDEGTAKGSAFPEWPTAAVFLSQLIIARRSG